MLVRGPFEGLLAFTAVLLSQPVLALFVFVGVTLIGIAGTHFDFKAPDLKQIDQMTLKVTAVRADGRESDEGATVIRLLP